MYGHDGKAEALVHALECNREGEVAKILKDDQNLASSELLGGQTNPMCRASYLGKKNMINLLLEAGANVDQADGKKGNTGLMWCASRDLPKMIEFLLAKGADPNLTNNEGFNALDVAVH